MTNQTEMCRWQNLSHLCYCILYLTTLPCCTQSIPKTYLIMTPTWKFHQKSHCTKLSCLVWRFVFYMMCVCCAQYKMHLTRIIHINICNCKRKIWSKMNDAPVTSSSYRLFSGSCKIIVQAILFLDKYRVVMNVVKFYNKL